MSFSKTSQARFLLVKMSALGDIILTLNVARYLKRVVPGCRVDWVVEQRFQELVKSSPYVDEALPLDTRLLKQSPLKFFSALYAFRGVLLHRYYDAIFDLQGNCKSALITMLSRGKDKVGWGKNSVFEWPNLLATRTRIEMDPQLSRGEQYLAYVQEYFQDKSPGDCLAHLLKPSNEHIAVEEAPLKIMVCPGSNWQNKRISQQTWIDFLKKIECRYQAFFVFIWGSPEEKEFAQTLGSLFPCSIIAGALSWSSWQSLMLNMHCVISVDSCALHLAGLAGVPTFSIYGPSSCQTYKPAGMQHHAYQGICPYGETFTNRCKFLRTCKTGACIKEIPAQTLMENFEKFITDASLLGVS